MGLLAFQDRTGQGRTAPLGGFHPRYQAQGSVSKPPRLEKREEGSEGHHKADAQLRAAATIGQSEHAQLSPCKFFVRDSPSPQK